MLSLNPNQIFSPLASVSLHWRWWLQPSAKRPSVCCHSPGLRAEGDCCCAVREAPRKAGCWSQEATSVPLLAARAISTQAATKAQSTRDSVVIAVSNEHRKWEMRVCLGLSVAGRRRNFSCFWMVGEVFTRCQSNTLELHSFTILKFTLTNH